MYLRWCQIFATLEILSFYVHSKTQRNQKISVWFTVNGTNLQTVFTTGIEPGTSYDVAITTHSGGAQSEPYISTTATRMSLLCCKPACYVMFSSRKFLVDIGLFYPHHAERFSSSELVCDRNTETKQPKVGVRTRIAGIVNLDFALIAALN